MKLIATLILALASVMPAWSQQVFPATTNRFNTFFSSNTFNKNLYLTNVGTVNTVESYSGTGTASSGAPRIFIGAKANSGDDSAINIGRNIQGTDLFSHGFRDESTFISTNTGAYCAFDSAYYLGGSTAYNHMNNFQVRPTFYGTGGIGEVMGMTFQPTINGPATTVSGIHIYNPAGTNYITNFYGILVTGNTRSNVGPCYSLYSSGTNELFNQGRISTSGNVSAATVTTTGDITSSAGNISVAFGKSLIASGYVLSSSAGFYNNNASKDSISVGAAALASGAFPWIISSGNATVYTNAYIALNVDGVTQMMVTNSGVLVGIIKSTNGFISEAVGPLTLLTNSTAPADTAIIRAWVNVTNYADGKVFKMPLYQ